MRHKTRITTIVQKGRTTIEPKSSFESLAGSLKSHISLTNNQLANARKDFTKQWADKS